MFLGYLFPLNEEFARIFFHRDMYITSGFWAVFVAWLLLTRGRESYTKVEVMWATFSASSSIGLNFDLVVSIRVKVGNVSEMTGAPVDVKHVEVLAPDEEAAGRSSRAMY